MVHDKLFVLLIFYVFFHSPKFFVSYWKQQCFCLLPLLSYKKTFFLIFIASTTNQNPIQRANMFLSKEATYKDQSLQMQMMLSFDKESSNNSEKVWKKKVFWGGQKEDFTITNPNFPEDLLVYCNQGTISTLKAGGYAIYLNYVILGQIILEINSPADLDNYVLKKNHFLKLYFICLYITPKLVILEV